MNYLAIDASTEACSVALSFQEKLFNQFELCPQSHSTRILPMVDEVLNQAGIKLTDLDGIIYGQGPGSFTGVRIGIGVVQGLAFAGNLPVVGVSTMQAMAQQAYQQYGVDEVIAAIDARMSEVYTGFYRLNEQGIMQAQQPEAVLPPKELAQYFQSQNLPSYGVGTGWDAYPNELNALRANQQEVEILYPDAQTMLDIGIVGFKEGKALSAEQAQPVYVRDTVSWKKLPGRE
ncbi:tRNA (adenosine(37)-N6)-threonylcarbamoyltransferase complex dimerization subunit type 1 TsaB [Thalassotalea ganghwensis]